MRRLTGDHALTLPLDFSLDDYALILHGILAKENVSSLSLFNERQQDNGGFAAHGAWHLCLVRQTPNKYQLR